MIFPSLYLNELVPSPCLNRHKVKLIHRLDFLWIPPLTENKPCLLSKCQFQNLNKVLHSKNQLHAMSRVIECLLVLVQRDVGTDCCHK